ncbi:carbonic anhydrase [Mytilus galloprovincialis]|uniref:carbonic anhydrase n=2 Tax=Mytilus galloprovincialis TaxID=29158 RepID=A0A8B6EZE4_MYTGA|nr:carbonic anhydrase [Mytilus galloprovincialis]
MCTRITRLVFVKSSRSIFNGLIRKAHNWGYRQGIVPEEWHTVFPLCNAKFQSPIDIKTSDVAYDSSLEKFNLEELEKTRDVDMVLCTNHGRSIQVNLQGHDIKVTGGSLPGTYKVEQFHFHWGPNNNVGSEHTYDGKQVTAELHIVMHLDKYSNAGEALKNENGLAVLGYLIDVGSHNKNYDEITDKVKNVQKQDDILPLQSFKLSSLLPSSKCYYRYLGSMTTPPCAPVIWTMFTENIYLSENQLQEFRNLGNTDMDLIHNCRSPRPLDGRIVTSNCNNSS